MKSAEADTDYRWQSEQQFLDEQEHQMELEAFVVEMVLSYKLTPRHAAYLRRELTPWVRVEPNDKQLNIEMACVGDPF